MLKVPLLIFEANVALACSENLDVKFKIVIMTFPPKNER